MTTVDQSKREYIDHERQQLQAVRDFNRDNRPGTWVTFTADGHTHADRTTSKALVVGSGQHMKAIVGVIRGRNVPLADITVIPDQPDGIEDDSTDLPDPQRAANRVLAYITAWGDGLRDTADGKHPLYARDLYALVRAVLDTAPTPAGRVESRHGRPVTDVHLPA